MGKLYRWDEIEEKGWDNLLLGNGFSINLSQKFDYKSLFQYAQDNGILSEKSQKLFEKFETKNFEEVLNKLYTAEGVSSILELSNLEKISDKYNAIQESLIKLIQKVHPKKSELEETILEYLNIYLREYNSIYTTNYDLLLYWIVMKNESKFVDFFWNDKGSFDIFNTELYDDSKTSVYYLHGALHLLPYEESKVRKIIRNILEKVDDNIKNNNLVPLFVSEGLYKKKTAEIIKSDYLSYCLHCLSKVKGGICIFGHSLSAKYDKHILDVLRIAYKNNQLKRIAIGIFNKKEQVKIVRQIKEHIPEMEKIDCFDVKTHPIYNIVQDPFEYEKIYQFIKQRKEKINNKVLKYLNDSHWYDIDSNCNINLLNVNDADIKLNSLMIIGIKEKYTLVRYQYFLNVSIEDGFCKYTLDKIKSYVIFSIYFNDEYRITKYCLCRRKVKYKININDVTLKVIC